MKRASWYMVVLLSRHPPPLIKCVPGQTYRSGRLTLDRDTFFLSSTAGLASAFER